MHFRGLGFLLVLALGITAALLAMPSQGDALGEKCSERGIVPGSALVVSSTNQAGQVAGHAVWFQLCQAPPVGLITQDHTPPLSRLSLLWTAGVEEGFYLDYRKDEEITLRMLGSDQWWNATGESYGGNCNVPNYGEGKAVHFTEDDIDGNIPASTAYPLTLQFEIPVSAGMVNPLQVGKYNWSIAAYYDHGSHYSTSIEQFNSTILEVGPREFRLSPSSGRPGSLVKISAPGFEPLAPLKSVRIGAIEIKPHEVIFADDRGYLELEVIIPGLEVGYHPISVQAGEATAVTEFLLVEAGGSWRNRAASGTCFRATGKPGQQT